MSVSTSHRPPRARRAPGRLVFPSLVLPCLLSGGALAAGCRSTAGPPPAQWVTMEFEVPSSRVLWEYAILSLEKTGYPVGAGLDPTTLHAVTGWQTHLSPFKGDGYRRRAEIRIEGADEGRYRVDARVQRQTNEALVRPTDPRYAEWRWAPDDEPAARVLLQHIRSYFAPRLELERG